MKSNTEYRKSALSSLKGRWTKAAIVSLIFLTIINLSSLVDFLAFQSTTTGFIESFNSLYTVFVILPAAFALIVVYLRMIRKPGTDIIRSFFTHFVSNYGRALLSMLLLAIICTCLGIAGITVSIALASIPFSLLDIPFSWTSITELHSIYGLIQIFKSVNLLLYTVVIGFFFMLTLIPMLMYIYKICLFPFIIEDNPDVGIRDAYHQSKVMIKGRRMRLFLLDLSFIGWYLLSLLTLGIALLWVIPYQLTARAHFYNDLKEEYDKSQYLSLE